MKYNAIRYELKEREMPTHTIRQIVPYRFEWKRLYQGLLLEGLNYIEMWIRKTKHCAFLHEPLPTT